MEKVATTYMYICVADDLAHVALYIGFFASHGLSFKGTNCNVHNVSFHDHLIQNTH